MNKIINEVIPFKAEHYNPEKVKEIGMCLSQPYDVISPEQQEAYYKQHEYNIIRLILNKIEDMDNEKNNRYTRVRDLIEDWKGKEVLHSYEEPSFWVYEQEYTLPEIGTKKIRGFIGLVKLAEFEEGKILPHEKVLKNPVEDRIKLTEITNTQLEYIWGMYQDKDFSIDTILEECEKSTPLIDHLEEDINVRHKLWRLQDPEKCGLITTRMERSRIYIADGHHRYQTMLNIRNARREARPGLPDGAPSDYIMMYLTNSEHQGLTVRATHRMVHGLGVKAWDDLFARIHDHFHTAEYKNKEEMLKDLENLGEGETKFGLYLKENRFFLLTLRNPEAYRGLYKKEYSHAWKMLDVNILNTLLLKKILGITEEQMSLNTNVKYTVSVEEGVKRVNSGEMEMFFILNPTKLQDVIDISDNNEVMPRKSTYFYPKPISGLVMYEMK